MNKYGVIIFGFFVFLIIVATFSGYSLPGKNEKLVYDFYAYQKVWNSNDGALTYNVTIPEEAKSVKIKYNLTPEFTGDAIGLNLERYSTLYIDAFDTVPTEGNKSNNYSHYKIDSKTVKITNNQNMAGIIEINHSNIKGIIISPLNLQGPIQVFITY